ncbi:MAG: 3-hydroxyacyl-[acyl-carrier-protein] dehydratase FabZ, partial [Acidobacteria bacterium]|nr:3-hydroxyacyl-[acyl-carrier-protein] dehydratase FabZ [Acidobacteriota bacterium]
RVEALSPGERAAGVKVVSGAEALGPGQAMPGLLILEAGAQLLGIAAAGAEGKEGAPAEEGYLAAVEEFRIYRKVAPGDRLIVEAVVSRRFGPLVQGEIKALVDGEVAAEGRLTAVSNR